jgi:hypothetical protein
MTFGHHSKNKQETQKAPEMFNHRPMFEEGRFTPISLQKQPLNFFKFNLI